MNERETFLDKLRVTATCAVVMLHTITGVMDHTDMSAYPMEKKVFLVAVAWVRFLARSVRDVVRP